MKNKTRNMKLLLSCKRKGAPIESTQVEWSEPEDKAKATYAKFHKGLNALLKEHGLLK